MCINKFYIFTFLIIASIFPGAGFSQESAGSQSAVLRFAYETRIGGAIPILTAAGGFFPKHGLNMDLQTFTSGPAISEALFLGAADIGTMGDTAAIIALAKNPRLMIIACQASGEHRHRLIVKADSPLASLADLRGRKVAVKKGTSTYGGFLAALKAAGIAPREIEIFDLSPETMIEALLAGSVDAFAASEPEPSLAEQKGGRELATFGGLENTYPIMIMAQKEILEKRPEDVVRFLRALRDGEAFLGANPAKAGEILSRVTGLSPDVLAGAMRRHEFHLGLDETTRKSLQEIAAFLVAEKKIPSVPDLDARILDAPLKETLKTSSQEMQQ